MFDVMEQQRVTQQGSRPKTKLNIMREAVIAEVSTQLSEVVGVIERHLEPTLLAVHLYGSAVDGGLKPHSDIDLLVTVTVRLDETTRRALINDLLETSASPGESEILRAVEVTIVVHDDIIPWRYPASANCNLENGSAIHSCRYLRASHDRH